MGIAAAVAVVLVVTFSSIRTDQAQKEEEFMAFQDELADFDIFLEIN